MNRLLLAGGLLGLLAATSVFADDKALADLQGSYKVQGLTKAGNEIPEEIRKTFTVKFKGDDMALVVGDKTNSAKVKVDAAATPKTIDISPTDGPDKGKTFPGIYKLENGELFIAFSEKTDRPKEFKAEGDTAVMRLKKE